MNLLRFVTVFVFYAFVAIPLQEVNAKSGDDAYTESLAAWKDKIVSLQQIRNQLAVAAGEEVAPLRARYMEAIRDGNDALMKFTAAAEAELVDNGERKKEAANFLKVRLIGLEALDDFERMARIGQLLMENGYQERPILVATGVAAYMTNQFEVAKDCLERANEKESLIRRNRELFDAIPVREAAWNEERSIREAEQIADDLPRVKLSTSQGDIELELFENDAPETVANFIHLIDQGFYDGLDFHRVIPHHVVQGGCPQGDGTGGPGYTIRSECLEGDPRRHFRGSLSMARSAEPHSGGSQFFLCLTPTSHLDGKHTVFGRVTNGMDVLAKLQRRDPSKKMDPSIEADKILKAQVERRRDHEYCPTPYVPGEAPAST